MKTSSRLTLAFSTLLFWSALQAPARAAPPKKSVLTGWHEVVAREAGLDPVQRTHLAKLAAKWHVQEDAFHAAYAKLKKQYEAARARNDGLAIEDIRKRKEDLLAERRAAKRKHELAVRGMLSEKQKLKLAVYSLCSRLDAPLAKAKLTKAQKAEVRALAAAPAKELMTLGLTEKKKARGIFNTFKHKVIETVLTDKQRAAVKKKPDKKALKTIEVPRP